MLTLDRITQRADEDGVDANVVERDYVLTHVVASMAMHSDSDIVQFKGGTSLRLCYFPDYRYSADIDLNLAPDASGERVEQFLKEVLAAARDRVALPYLELNPGPPVRIEFIGPKQTKRPRTIKLDMSADELGTGDENRSILLQRYEDQIETLPMRVYSLGETAAEKLRSIMQRLQCRDLYDTWHLLEHAGVDAAQIRPDFEAKTRHRGLDPAEFPSRFDSRIEEYRRRWAEELSPYLSVAPHVDRVFRETSRHLRQAGYM